MICLELCSNRLFSNSNNNREGRRCDSQLFREENQLLEPSLYILTQISSEAEEQIIKKVNSDSLLMHIYLEVEVTISRATFKNSL